MSKRNFLVGLKVNEVSLVDDPGNPLARIALVKALDAGIKGATAVRKALVDARGDEAGAIFDAVLTGHRANLATILGMGAEGPRQAAADAVATFGKALDAALVSDDADAVKGAVEAALATLDGVISGAVSGITKAANAWKPCADCPDPKQCAGKCQMEGDAKGKTPVAKAATSFAELNATRELQEEVQEMVWTLSSSLNSILQDSDKSVAERLTLIRNSVGEFDTAIVAVIESGDESMVEKSRTPGAPPMTQQTPAGQQSATPATPAATTALDATAIESSPFVKALQDRLAALEAGQSQTVAFAKAKAMLPNGGPVPELAALLATMNDDQVKGVEAIVKSLGAQGAHAALFQALGAAGQPGAGNAPAAGEGDESVLVAKAKATREAYFKDRRAA